MGAGELVAVTGAGAMAVVMVAVVTAVGREGWVEAMAAGVMVGA